MRRVYVVCRQCGYEEKQDIYDAEEAAQKSIRLGPPRCSKCGSMDVKIAS